jgi:hypothetical protein
MNELNEDERVERLLAEGKLTGFEAKPYFEAEAKALQGVKDPFGRRSEG